MSEELKHPLVDLTDQILENPSVVGISEAINIDEEREEKPGDIGIGVIEAVLEEGELTVGQMERVVKIINHLADKKGKTAQEIFITILKIAKE